MNVAIGRIGEAFGLAGAFFGIVTLAIGLYDHRPEILRMVRWFIGFTAFGAVLAVFAMERALITRDFTMSFVHDHGSSRTPALFNVATMWSALEGSILLWVLILCGYLVMTTVHFRKRLTDPMVAWALLTMLVVTLFFFALMTWPAQPFHAVSNVPLGYDGPGPNPLLQNHILMAFHPPMLYLGYVGFTVPFAFAIAALVTGRLGEGWLLETRRWTLFAWGFLTVGIVLGAWWSYEVLGWGGAWAWDPVENASFLPWLTATAYLHSVMVQERRGMLRVWNLSLLCATFALTILGTFLTRSGVLDSVHAFSESDIGVWILTFFGLIVLVTLGLIGWRGDRLRSPGRIDSPLSREASFLYNNMLFAAFALVVLLGTVFPLIVEAVDNNRVSVGPPYFNDMTTPIGLALLFLMAVAPALPWRATNVETLGRRVQWPAWTGALCMVAAVLIGARGWKELLAFGLGGFAIGAAARQVILATRRQGWRGLVGRTNGGMIVHVGVVILAVGLVTSNSYSKQGDFTMTKGSSASLAGYTLTYLDSRTETDDQRTAQVVDIRIAGGPSYAVPLGETFTRLPGPFHKHSDHVYSPSLRTFANGTQPIGTPSVRTGLVDDVYLSLVASDADGSSITVRAFVKPLAGWMWAGGSIMALGTVLAAWPGRRRRRPTDPVSAPVPVGATLDDDPGADRHPDPEPAGV